MREVAREEPLIVIDYVCPHAAEMTPAALDWSLANYLLLMGDRTYLAIEPEVTEQGPLDDPPQMHLDTGRAKGDFHERDGIFYREFERALPLVNPSSTAAAQFDLAADSASHDPHG